MGATPRFQSSRDSLGSPGPEDLAIAQLDGSILMRLDPRGAGPTLPSFDSASLPAGGLRIGDLDGRPCFALRLAEGHPAPEDMAFLTLRRVLAECDPVTAGVASRAAQLLEWDRTHAHCGVCGSRTEPASGEMARRCPACGAAHYPRVSPAVLVRVEREGRLLLARNAAFPTAFHSVLAGFVEPGESLEETVVREVREEVGIEVGGIEYFGSQAWPFPSQLMVAFTARWVSGEVELRDGELESAAWFAPDALPAVPGGVSLSGRLIAAFAAQSRAGSGVQEPSRPR